MHVFLLHGMARTPASMFLLSQRLKKAGHTTHLFGYFVTVRSLAAIAERLVRRVERELAKDVPEGEEGGKPRPYAIIGHSLGNVIARMALPKLPEGLCCLAMIAPPNHSPVSARWLEGNAIFRLLTQDAGRKLADPEFMETVPEPAVPTLVIAGTRGPKKSWLPFEGKPNDGIVALDETHLDGAVHLEVEGVHTFLMNRRDVFESIRDFLEDAASDRADPA